MKNVWFTETEITPNRLNVREPFARNSLLTVVLICLISVNQTTCAGRLLWKHMRKELKCASQKHQRFQRIQGMTSELRWRITSS